MRWKNPQRYRQHLIYGWPLVVNLLLITLIEQVLDSVLNFGTTPFDRVLPPQIADVAWHGLLWTLVIAAFVLYVTAHTASLREVVVGIMAVFTLGLILNVIDLAVPSPRHMETRGSGLLLDGLLIWLNNVVLFTVWYWLLDGGGHMRRVEDRWAPRDFLFPPQATALADYPHWHPLYVDYLFLAFTTGTAFGPTDTQTLSRRAKLLQMCQSTISLVVVTVIVARAINNLSSG
jgi:hypothetical protein